MKTITRQYVYLKINRINGTIKKGLTEWAGITNTKRI